MSYMIENIEKGRTWRSYFDYIVVDARKPLFFEEGTTLKEINIVSLSLKSSKHLLTSDPIYMSFISAMPIITKSDKRIANKYG